MLKMAGKRWSILDSFPFQQVKTEHLGHLKKKKERNVNLQLSGDFRNPSEFLGH